MESLSFSHLPISPKTLNPKPSPKTLTLILPQNPNPNSLPTPKALKPLSTLLKPALLSLTAASAIFLSRRSLAAVSNPNPNPISQSQTLSSSDEHSEQALEQHLTSHPNDVESLQALVQLKVKHQKLPEAIAAVDRLLLLDPTDPELHLLNAHLHTYSGDTAKARKGFEEILSLNPFVVEAYHGLVMAASRSLDVKALDRVLERVEGVIEICEKERKWKEVRDFKLLVAQVLIIEGKYEEALKMYEEMVKDEPRDFRPYLCRGIVFTLMRKMDEADTSFRKYRKLVPKNHPYAQLFESNLSGINAAIKKKDENSMDGSVQS